MTEDIVSTDDDRQPGKPLIQKVMSGGRRVGSKPSLDELRSRTSRELQRLPGSLQRLEPGARHMVRIAEPLQ